MWLMTRVTALTIALTCAWPAAAQPAQPGMPAGPGEMSPAQVQQLFDAMLVMQAQEALSLSEQQYGQFLTRLKLLQDTRRRNQQERFRLIGELQRLTHPGRPRASASDGELKERLGALHELEARSAVEVRRAYTAIDEVLDPQQQARFRVFEEQIERRKLELIGRARQNRPNRPQNPNRQAPPRRPPG